MGLTSPAVSLKVTAEPLVSAHHKQSHTQQPDDHLDGCTFFSWKVFPGEGRKATCVHLSFSLPPTARVCDNILLRCQNGGVCHHHQRCQCPAGFSGILCEKTQCQGDTCEELQSSQTALRPRPVAQTLPLALLSLIPSLLATRGLTSL